MLFIGISYNTDGTRYVSNMTYKINADQTDVQFIGAMFKGGCDEVYTLDTFNPNCKSFIEEIVLNGCRL